MVAMPRSARKEHMQTCLQRAGPDLTGIAMRVDAPAALPPADDSDDSRPGSAAADVPTAQPSVAVASVSVAVEATTHPETPPADPLPDIAGTAARAAAGEVYVEVTGVADTAAASTGSIRENTGAPGRQPLWTALQTRGSAAHGKAPTPRSSRAASVVSGRTRTLAGRAAKQQPRTRVAGETRASSGTSAVVACCRSHWTCSSNKGCRNLSPPCISSQKQHI